MQDGTFNMFFLGYYCSPDDSVRRYRRDHSPEEAVTEDNYQEELEDQEEEQEEEQEYEYQEEELEDKEEHESCVVEASLPDVLPVSWQQPVLLPDLLDQGSDATDGEGSKEYRRYNGSNGEEREKISEVDGGGESVEEMEERRGGEEREGGRGWGREGHHLSRMTKMDQVQVNVADRQKCLRPKNMYFRNKN